MGWSHPNSSHQKFPPKIFAVSFYCSTSTGGDKKGKPIHPNTKKFVIKSVIIKARVKVRVDATYIILP